MSKCGRLLMRPQPDNGDQRVRRGKRMLWASLLFLGLGLASLAAGFALFSQGCNLSYF